MKNRKLIFEISSDGRKSYSLPECGVPQSDISALLPPGMKRESQTIFPSVSEVDVVRHFIELSSCNYGVDSGFYPLGSCTMKYNPKINELVARLDGFAHVHPYQDPQTVQGCLELMYNTGKMLSEIAGMDRVSLQPAAGAHGEMTGLMIIKAYHQSRGDFKRNKMIIPDSAHGTNPASAAVAGFESVELKSDERGCVDLDALSGLLNDEIAGLMLTNPNTLGLFDENICKIADLVHRAGGLLYCDGANTNAIMGITRPGDMGFDVVHLNLHKSFSTPHGGGGPGAGPVGVKAFLEEFLPTPVVEKKGDAFILDDNRPKSIGRIKSFYGNFLVAVRAYAYILSMGSDGLKKASETAVLNANYIRKQLSGHYHLPYDRICMHEVVFSAQKQKAGGVSALDIAKTLLDYGYHPPTIYFPLIVGEAMMIEPTETEGKETIDEFIRVMIEIAEDAENDPEKLKNTPYHTVISRVDETGAARNPRLKFEP